MKDRDGVERGAGKLLPRPPAVVCFTDIEGGDDGDASPITFPIHTYREYHGKAVTPVTFRRSINWRLVQCLSIFSLVWFSSQ